MKLTARKREILELASQGYTDKQIAQALGIGFGTIQTHWKQIRGLLGVSSRTEATAKVFMHDARSELEELERDRVSLNSQLQNSSSQTADLEEQIRELQELVKRQADFLTSSIANTDRKVAQLVAQLERLERLNELTKKQRVLLHDGEYGASWRKFFMSDSVEFSGTEPQEWEKGEVNFFDLIGPEYVVRNIPAFEPFSRGVHRLCLTYSVKTPEGPRFMLDFLTSDFLDNSGVGTYMGISIDVTDWVEKLQELCDRGWLQPIPGTLDSPI